MTQPQNIDKGTGEPTVVLIHGICCAATDYSWHIDALSKSHRVIAPTMRAHGDSDSREFTTEQLTIEQLSSEIASLLVEKDITGAVLCGHSLGVRVVLEVHRQVPERVAGLVFIDGSNSVSNNLDSVLDAFDAATTGDKITPWIQGLFKEMFLPGKFAEEQNRYRQRITNMPDENLRALYRNLIIWDGQQFAQQLKNAADKPLLVVQSTVRDTVAARRSLKPGETGDFPQQIAESHPHTSIVIYAGRSHFINLDEPEKLLEDLLLWMKNNGLC